MARLRNYRRSGNRGGFTLIEVLVALGVMGIATGIFISLFTSSLDLSRKAAKETVAANIAESKLSMIVRHPDRMVWEFERRDSHGRIPLLVDLEDPPAGNRVDLPLAMPADESAHAREKNFYQDFRWSAFAENEQGASYYVVSVVVRWEEAGRERSLALTSALPAFEALTPAVPETEPSE